jgi:hypothetical protein
MTAREDFALPTFHGGRFESASLPVDVLSDLAAYRDLILDLAKHLFTLREPERKRLPKGFADSFQIGIRAIEPGSTIAVLDRQSPASGIDFFGEARDLLEKVVKAASQRAALPTKFPAHLIKRFNQVGRGLRDDEYIELRNPGATSGCRYDRTIRKWIVVQHEGRYEDAADLAGWVSGGDVTRETITIKLEDGALVDGRCSPAMVRQTLALLEQRVRVVGVGSYDRNDRFEKFLRIDDIVTPDDDDGTRPTSSLEKQFADLAALPHGWFEADTPVLNRDGLDVALSFLHAVTTQGIPVPHVYPTPDAEARAEWSMAGWEVSATFQLEARTVRLHATHTESDMSEEAEELKLADAQTPELFVHFIRQPAA